MKSLRWLSLFAAAFLTTLLPGCTSHYTKTTVAFVTNNAGEFWLIVENGTRRLPRKKTLTSPSAVRPMEPLPSRKTSSTPNWQKGVKAVSVSVISPDNQTEFLNGIADQGATAGRRQRCGQKQTPLLYRHR